MLLLLLSTFFQIKYEQLFHTKCLISKIVSHVPALNVYFELDLAACVL